MTLEELYEKNVLNLMCTFRAEFVLCLIGAHLIFLGHLTLQAPKTFVHNQCHEDSPFVLFLSVVLILLFIVGAL